MGSSEKSVFISYSRADATMARRIRSELERGGLDVWFDESEINPGESFLARMSEGLAKASYVVLLCSPASLSSRWVSREWMSTLARTDRVLVPVKIAPVEMPVLLSDILYVDLTERYDQGMARLIKFFHDEAATPAQLAGRPVFHSTKTTAPVDQKDARDQDSTLLRHAELHEIRKIAKRCVDLLTLREYLFDQQIEEGRLKGESLHERLIDLLHTLSRDGELQHFVHWLESERGKCVQIHLKAIRSAGA